MPRRSSFRRSSGQAPHPARQPPPKPVHHDSPPSHLAKSGHIRSTIGEGIKFGVGSAVGHRVVDAVAGRPTIYHETVVSPTAAAAPEPTAPTMSGSDACYVPLRAFHDCLNRSSDEISLCQFYMDALAECRKNSGSMMSS